MTSGDNMTSLYHSDVTRLSVTGSTDKRPTEMPVIQSKNRQRRIVWTIVIIMKIMADRVHNITALDKSDIIYHR